MLTLEPVREEELTLILDEAIKDEIACQAKGCSHTADLRVLCRLCRHLVATVCNGCYAAYAESRRDTRMQCGGCPNSEIGLDRATIIIPLDA